MAEIILETSHLECSRLMQVEEPSAVHAVNLCIERGCHAHFFGPPHSGKNLLLHLLGLLDRPDSGSLRLLGQETSSWTEDERGAFRNRHFGFIFSSPYLLPAFSVVENVAMPLFKITGTELEEARERTVALLALTGLSKKADIPAHRLGLADQHRVALARALVNEPTFLVCESFQAGMPSAVHADFINSIKSLGTDLGLTLLLSEGQNPQPGWRSFAVEEGRVNEVSSTILPGWS